MAGSVRVLAVAVAAVMGLCALRGVEGHARLLQPSSRSSVWRLPAFKGRVPVNYDDNQLNCGGKAHQWEMHDGKCGICGDPWEGPRDNEAGGKYASPTGLITAEYQEGEAVEVTVEVTANHLGWFEFRVCPVAEEGVPVTQDCLDRHLLELAGGTGSRYMLGTQRGMVRVNVQLPMGLACDHCVFQWKWHAGNDWGRDEDGRGCRGCGRVQEEFYGCADIRITAIGEGGSDPGEGKPGDTSTTTTSTPTTTTTPTTNPTTTIPAAGTKVCKGAGAWATSPGMDQWCVNNCARGYCPPSHCKCVLVATTSIKPSPTTKTVVSPETTTVSTIGHPTTTVKATTPTTEPTTTIPAAGTKVCKAAGVWATQPGMDQWCVDNCARGYCPSSHCRCVLVATTTVKPSPITTHTTVAPPATTESTVGPPSNTASTQTTNIADTKMAPMTTIPASITTESPNMSTATTENSTCRVYGAQNDSNVMTTLYCSVLCLEDQCPYDECTCIDDVYTGPKCYPAEEYNHLPREVIQSYCTQMATVGKYTSKYCQCPET